MEKVDMWLGTPYEIRVDKNGLYYICDYGEIISPPFATHEAATRNGWKYMKSDRK